MNCFRAVATVCTCLAFLAGCAAPSGSRLDPAADCCAGKAIAPVHADRSVYELTTRWETDAAQRMKLGDLRGRPQVISMFFASCRVACPITIGKLKEIESALPPGLRSRVGFTLITFDPGRDTPEALRAFRKEQQFGEGWTLLRGSEAATRQVAGRLGISFERESYRLIHSNEILLLDADGKILFRLTGLRTPTKDLIQAAQSAASPLKPVVP